MGKRIRAIAKAVAVWAVGNLLWNGTQAAFAIGGSAVITGIVGTFFAVATGMPTPYLVLLSFGTFLLGLAGLGEIGHRLGIGEKLAVDANQIAQQASPPRVILHSPKVVQLANRVSVTEDIDRDYCRLKVTNLAAERQDFEVKFFDFYGTGEKETAYSARWRATRQPGEALKARDSDYINAVQCLGPTGQGTTILRFYTADIPAGHSDAHYFDRVVLTCSPKTVPL